MDMQFKWQYVKMLTVIIIPYNNMCECVRVCVCVCVYLCVCV